MVINYEISRCTLGDCNTEDENSQYVAAVQVALTEEYPFADVTVELTDDSSTCFVSDEDMLENVNQIANRVWDTSKY